MGRRSALILVVLLALALPAAAQTTPGERYVFAGWTMASRRASQFPGATYGVMPHGLTLGIGTPIGRGARLELSSGWSGRTRIDWFYSYVFSRTGDRRTTERDVPVLVSLRSGQHCSRKVCVNVVGGMGLNWHMVQTDFLTACASPFSREGCTPEDGAASEPDHLEPIFAVGADVPIRLSPRVSLAPSFRFRFTQREERLTGYTHRGPAELRTFGIVVGATLFFKP